MPQHLGIGEEVHSEHSEEEEDSNNSSSDSDESMMSDITVTINEQKRNHQMYGEDRPLSLQYKE